MALDSVSINTIFGPGSYIKGDIKISGFARIDGDIEGNITATGKLILGEKSRVLGNVTAKSVTVLGGIVQGDICAPEFVKLLSSSVVIGDIQTKTLSAEENVLMNGHCIALSDETEYDAAVSRHENMKAISSVAIRD